MRRSLTLFALLGVFSVLALAESWQGRLVDATCYAQKKSEATCDPTGSTAAFALVVANKALIFDESGNAKVADALKSRADRSTEPAKPPSTQIMAKVTGTKEGDAGPLKVEAIEIQ